LVVPHAPATQVVVTHSPAGGGQSLGIVQTPVAPPEPPVPEPALLLVAPPVPLALELAVAPPLPPTPVVVRNPPPAPPAPVLVELTAEVTVVPPPSPLPPAPPVPGVGLDPQPTPPTPPTKIAAAVNQRMGSLDARMNHPAAKEIAAGDNRASAA
jgi:hypothetical protein